MNCFIFQRDVINDDCGYFMLCSLSLLVRLRHVNVSHMHSAEYCWWHFC